MRAHPVNADKYWESRPFRSPRYHSVRPAPLSSWVLGAISTAKRRESSPSSHERNSSPGRFFCLPNSCSLRSQLKSPPGPGSISQIDLISATRSGAVSRK